MTSSKKNSVSQGDSLTTSSSRKEPINQSSLDAVVYLKEEQLITTSRMVAKVFGKNHKDVLRGIKNLEGNDGFGDRRNFTPIFFKDQYGRKQPEYQITRDGFVLLVMGYTGERAMQFKKGYIEQFNYMERSMRKGIHIEKEMSGQLADVKYVQMPDGKWYVYTEVLRKIGLSTHSGAVSLRKRRFPECFMKLMDRINLVHEKFVAHLAQTKRVLEQSRQLSLEFEKGAGGL